MVRRAWHQSSPPTCTCVLDATERSRKRWCVDMGEHTTTRRERVVVGHQNGVVLPARTDHGRHGRRWNHSYSTASARLGGCLVAPAKV
jgi:hypothetical protein